MLLVAEQAGALAVEDDEEFLLGSVTMGRAVELSFGNDLVAHARAQGAGLAAEEPADPAAIAVLPFLRLGLIDVDDVLRPRRRLAERERLGLRLDVPGIVRAALDPGPAEADRP